MSTIGISKLKDPNFIRDAVGKIAVEFNDDDRSVLRAGVINDVQHLVDGRVAIGLCFPIVRFQIGKTSFLQEQLLIVEEGDGVYLEKCPACACITGASKKVLHFSFYEKKNNSIITKEDLLAFLNTLKAS